MGCQSIVTGGCQSIATGGLRSHLEANEHINYVELLATFLGLKTFAKTRRNLHIRLMIDNTSVGGIINNMGTSHSLECNILAHQVWGWCIERQIWISAAHQPGPGRRKHQKIGGGGHRLLGAL